MIFTTLTVTNFGVFRGQYDFELRPRTWQGENRPVILFGGKNGAGKTTLLEAIRLCLYGRSALGTRVRRIDYETYIRQRINRNAETPSAQVRLIFEHTYAGVRSTYDAVRSWRVTEHQVEETISIFKNGMAFQEITQEHWEDFLRDLIPSGISDLFFFDGEQIQALADDETETAALETAIKGLLNLDLVGQLKTDLITYLRQQDVQERSKLQIAIEKIDQEYKTQTEHELERRQDRAQLVARLDRTQYQLNTARETLLSEGVGFVEQRVATENRLSEIEQEIEQVEAAIRDLAAGLFPFAVAPIWSQKLRERLDFEADAERARLVYEAQRQQASQIALKLRDAEFQRKAAPNVQPQDWRKIEKRINKLLQPENEPADFDIRHKLSTQDRNKVSLWIEEATQSIPRRTHELAQRLEALEVERGKLEQTLKQVPDTSGVNPLLDEFNHLSETKGALEQQIADITEELRRYEIELAELDRQRRKTWQQLLEIGNSEDRVTQAAKVQLVLDRYLERITTLRIRELEQAVAEYFNVLCRKQMLVREVSIDPKHFTVFLYGDNRTPIYKSDLSAGEKQLYAMALLWALRSVSGRALPLIIDSPMGRLDSDHREAMLKQFFPHAAHQIILLSTDTEIDAKLYPLLEPSLSHVFRLDFDEKQGCTQVHRDYFVDEEVIA